MGGLVPPPPHLQVRAAGEYYPHFIEHGDALLDALGAALLEIGRDWRSFDSILDFGCGCARVLRALHYRSSAAQKLHGTDIDKEAVDWCRANYSTVAEFTVNAVAPPMAYGDGMFDLVFSVSTFTHLPEDMQDAWLKELRRVTRPGGYLLLTTHNQSYFQNLPEGLRQKAQDRGFFYQRCKDTEGLPDFYQVAYHTPEYIRSRWSEYFDILDIHERAIDGHQDIVACRKR
jgi:SAM-dependent methyltransferase